MSMESDFSDVNKTKEPAKESSAAEREKALGYRNGTASEWSEAVRATSGEEKIWRRY